MTERVQNSNCCLQRHLTLSKVNLLQEKTTVFKNLKLVRDFFQQLKEFLAANPSEFCLLTVDLSATSNKEAWGKAYSELVSSDEFRSLFADFKPRLTVGELRGHVLMLSRQEYAQQPIGG